MKKLYSLLIFALLAGCMSPIIESDEIIADMQSSVRILTRSSSEISYPLTLYAFDLSEGVLVSFATQEASTEELVITIPQGDYYFVALAGMEECVIPDSPTLSSLISLPSTGLLTEPLQMGSASVSVSQNTTVDITLYNQVAAVELSLYDVPDEATAVTTSISLVSSAVSFDGTYSGNSTVQVPLSKQDDVWTTPAFYTFPSSSGKMTLSISMTTPDGTLTYGYTHPSKLLANTPYVCSGSFISGFRVNGVLSLAGWNEQELIEFTFGVSQDGGNEDEPGGDDGVNDADVVPKVGSLWKGHIVAAHLDEDADSVLMLLLSSAEWTGIASANNETESTMAVDVASVYAEGDMIGWSIPTRDDARVMCAKLGGANLSLTNSFLQQNDMAPLSVGDDIRYLCDDAAFSFKWDSGGSVSKAGSKRTYHLRLVRRVRIPTSR